MKWLAREGSFFVIARRGDALLGYAMVEMRDGGPMWDMGERLADLRAKKEGGHANG